MFSLNAFAEVDFFSGMSLPFFSWLGCFGRLFKVFGRRRAGSAGFAHFLAAAGLNALTFSVNICVQPRFSRHFLALPSFERRFGAFAVFGTRRNSTHSGAERLLPSFIRFRLRVRCRCL